MFAILPRYIDECNLTPSCLLMNVYIMSMIDFEYFRKKFNKVYVTDDFFPCIRFD